MKIAITGWRGLLGWHAAARIHAQNCAARYRGEPPIFELVLLDREAFQDPGRLAEALKGVEGVLHFAGVNRGPDDDVEAGNPAIARQLVEALDRAGTRARIVYSNSTHSTADTPYGRSKRQAGEILGSSLNPCIDMTLPHIFGECARPNYNNVTATLIDHLWKGTRPDINPLGRVELLHAGVVADTAIAALLGGEAQARRLDGRDLSIAELWERLQGFHDLYGRNIFPDLSDPFDLQLFNCYRTAAYPDHYPRVLTLNRDHRGTLFESAKGGNASHTFLSTTLPGKTRGDHFHLDLVERFVVVKGKGVIRIRKVLTDEVHSFTVSGEEPVAIDQIPLHTHSIENIGDDELVTFFWSHRMFDPANPDTYADPVLP